LQDPLAELVKIEPKAIGVGQYQLKNQMSLLQSCIFNKCFINNKNLSFYSFYCL